MMMMLVKIIIVIIIIKMIIINNNNNNNNNNKHLIYPDIHRVLPCNCMKSNRTDNCKFSSVGSTGN